MNPDLNFLAQYMTLYALAYNSIIIICHSIIKRTYKFGHFSEKYLKGIFFFFLGKNKIVNRAAFKRLNDAVLAKKTKRFFFYFGFNKRTNKCLITVTFS